MLRHDFNSLVCDLVQTFDGEVGDGRAVPEEVHQPFVVQQGESVQEYLQIPYAHTREESREVQEDRMVGSESPPAPETKTSLLLLPRLGVGCVAGEDGVILET